MHEPVAHALELDAISKGLAHLTAEQCYRLKYQPVEADLVLQGNRQEVQIGYWSSTPIRGIILRSPLYVSFSLQFLTAL